MSSHYTNIQTWGNSVLFRGVVAGKRVSKRLKYSPSLWLPTNKVTEWRTLHDENLEHRTFEDISTAKKFVQTYEGVDNAPTIYGQTRFEYAFIAENYQEEIEWSIEDLIITMLDIEVGSENGFPDPYQATEPVTAITISYLGGKTYTFGCGDYEVKGDEIYVKCPDEYHLLKRFLTLWSSDYPDIVSGWNSKGFDIPYLYNRMNKILGDEETKKLSPWKFIMERKERSKYGNQFVVYEIKGISSLDYQDLYKWYSPKGKSQENYKLNTIAVDELKVAKISYDEYDSLHDLYKYDYQKYIEYNIQDVRILLRLEDKLKLLEMAITLAFDTKSNFEDVFAQTRMWDAMTNSYLFNNGIIVPPRLIHEKDEAFKGAFVKDVQVGLHECVAAFDLDSLYPHLMMNYNISPESLIQPENYTPVMRRIIAEGVSVDKFLNMEVDLTGLENATVTPNGQFFRTDRRGFLTTMLDEMYVGRKTFKKKSIEAKKQLEAEKDKSKHFAIEKIIARFNNLQLAKKVSLNSCYGATGSKYFRFYDIRMALAVTSSGQLSIRWIEKKLNEYLNKIMGTKDFDFIIAMDTDSAYINLGPLVKKCFIDISKVTKNQIINFMDKVCSEKINPFIAKSFQELADYMHAYEQKMNMKRESLSDKGIWTAKKRYILSVWDMEGVRYSEPDIKITGMQMIQSSTPATVRGYMKDLVKLILTGSENDVQEFVFRIKSDFKKLAPEDISKPSGVNGLKEYSDAALLYKKGTPFHVKGALLYNNFIKTNSLMKKYKLIQEGEKIKTTYLKMPNTLKDEVISFPDRIPKEMGLEEYVDYDVQFEKTFLAPITVVLDCMGWKAEKQSSLEDFFL